MSDDLATQDVLDNEVNDGADDGSGGGEDQPFLRVNDRTSYKTADEAVKGFAEAQKTITSLSEYQKVAKEFGITDPKVIRQLFLELVDHREKAKAATTKSTKQATPAEGDEQLTPEEKKAQDWLKKNAAKAGYVSKSDFDKLMERLDKFENSGKEANEAQAKALVVEGQEALTSLLEAGKVTLTEDQRLEVEDNIKAWINGSDDRVARWWGTAAQRAALVKQGMERELKAMGISPAASAVATGKTKAQLINRTTKPLPKDGAPGKGGKEKQPDPRAKRQGLHSRAWALMQQTLNGDQEE